jgi:hypothetical protein
LEKKQVQFQKNMQENTIAFLIIFFLSKTDEIPFRKENLCLWNCLFRKERLA